MDCRGFLVNRNQILKKPGESYSSPIADRYTSNRKYIHKKRNNIFFVDNFNFNQCIESVQQMYFINYMFFCANAHEK